MRNFVCFRSQPEAASLVVSGCGPAPERSPKRHDTTIKIGNAASVSEPMPPLAIPFNAGIKTRLMEANANPGRRPDD
jgi:hypothetical protein